MAMIDLAEMRRQAKILVVDDSPTNVMLLEMILSSAGYVNAQSVTDPREVCGLYEANKFDLILLDIRMPELDGFQVMEQLKEALEDDYLPVLVLTAQTDKETRARAIELGAKDFVTKPFDRTEVLNRIRTLLDVRVLYNERRRQSEMLEEQVRERTQELRDTRLEIIRRLGRAGEYRDNETGMHVIRMSKSCQILGLAYGLSEEEGELLVQASPMHDVGKIGIPDNILLKPGKLNAKEWEVMKTHSSIGADILDGSKADIMRMARDIALTHHEKWDGGGYPAGLAGEAIPLAGRIAAISDVFDALTSERPYKKPWPVEEARRFISENSGSHFDPKLAAIFLEILPDILVIRERYHD